MRSSQIEIKFDTHISELEVIENCKDPPQKEHDIGRWYEVKIKKIKEKIRIRSKK